MSKWLGKAKRCDLCGLPFDTAQENINGRKYFVDGKTKEGPWVLMCADCHRWHGLGLGTGLGQAYDLITKEKIRG